MPTTRQLAANRRNAQKSTGPRSVEGKSASSLNALKNGIDARSTLIPGEIPAELSALAADYRARFNPDTPELRFLVDTLIRCDWLTRRLDKVEGELWAEFIVRSERSSGQDNPLADAYSCASSYFERLQTRLNAIQRNYQRALREIARLQTAKPADPPPPPPPQPEEIKPKTPKLASFPNPVPPPPAAAPSPAADVLFPTPPAPDQIREEPMLR